MKNNIFSIKKIFILSMVMNLLSCDSNSSELYCKSLQELAQSPEIQKKLNDWVGENIVGKDILKKDVKRGGGMVPGVYWYPIDFDWKLLGFNAQQAKIRIVGPYVGEEIDGKLTNIKSIFFGERSRFGILVRNPMATEFGVDENSLISISKDIAVICQKRD